MHASVYPPPSMGITVQLTRPQVEFQLLLGTEKSEKNNMNIRIN
jgi:hypothetical protein